MPETRLEFNDEQGHRTMLVDSDVFTIGRRAGNDLTLTHAGLSRDHAELVRRGDDYIIRDKESRFGCFVNGERVTEKKLKHMDRVLFGSNGPEIIYLHGEPGSVGSVTDIAVGDLRQISFLLEGLRAVGSSRVLEDVLALVLDSSIDVSGAERGFIMLANSHAGPNGVLEFKLGRARGRHTLDGDVFNISRKVPEQVWLTGRTQILLDMLENSVGAMHGATVAMGIRNVMCVPLTLVRFAEGGRAAPEAESRLGVLYLDSRGKGALDSPVTRTALETLAREAAVAIENTRLYREALDKARMEQELQIARQMQQALLPERRRLGADFEAVGSMAPCLDIGGDFFDYLDLPGGRVGFVLSDVSGKGPSAALMAALIQGVFRGHAEDLTEGGEGPAAAMTRVNRVLANRAVKSRYATSFYGVLSPGGRFVFCNAGHNPPMLAKLDGTCLRLDTGGLPVGMFPRATYDEQDLILEPGDTLLLFSDGLSEASNPSDEEFGDSRLLECLCGSRHWQPAELLEHLLEKVNAFAGTQPQGDDMTGLIIRRLPAAVTVIA